MPAQREVPSERLTNGHSGTGQRFLGVDEEGRNIFSTGGRSVTSNAPVASANHRPETPIQALMEARPFDEPETSKMEMLGLRDILADALDALDARERWIFEGRCIRKLSVRQLAVELAMPHSTVWLVYQRAVGNLREILSAQPLIVEYLLRGSAEDSESEPND